MPKKKKKIVNQQVRNLFLRRNTDIENVIMLKCYNQLKHNKTGRYYNDRYRD